MQTYKAGNLHTLLLQSQLAASGCSLFLAQALVHWINCHQVVENEIKHCGPQTSRAIVLALTIDLDHVPEAQRLIISEGRQGPPSTVQSPDDILPRVACAHTHKVEAIATSY